MKTSFALFAAVALVSFQAQAFENEMGIDLAMEMEQSVDHHPGHGAHHPGNQGHGKPNPACKKIKPTAAQKAELKTTFAEMKKGMVEIRKEMQAARKAYVQLVITPSSDLVAADAASDKIQAAAAKALELRTSTMNKIYFKILTAEQRKPALACFSKKRPQGHGQGHGHGPGHGGHGPQF